jgi:hypothetical protein
MKQSTIIQVVENTGSKVIAFAVGQIIQGELKHFPRVLTMTKCYHPEQHKFYSAFKKGDVLYVELITILGEKHWHIVDTIDLDDEVGKEDDKFIKLPMSELAKMDDDERSSYIRNLIIHRIEKNNPSTEISSSELTKMDDDERKSYIDKLVIARVTRNNP